MGCIWILNADFNNGITICYWNIYPQGASDVYYTLPISYSTYSVTYLERLESETQTGVRNWDAYVKEKPNEKKNPSQVRIYTSVIYYIYCFSIGY